MGLWVCLIAVVEEVLLFCEFHKSWNLWMHFETVKFRTCVSPLNILDEKV